MRMIPSLDALQKAIVTEIPLAGSMGVRITGYDGHSLRLQAPLAPNRNHKQTAFGGSLYSLAVLAGWSLLHLQLHERQLQGHIVIYEASVRYHRPVTLDPLIAACELPVSGTLDRFLQAYARKGMARIRLSPTIAGVDGPAASLLATYVVHGRERVGN
jgi:thioesterase domain-containing protein